eukprot:CAMPEP_0197034242 /NCGR_PEP_ID=MMETSP1384-20130603/12409_1 /TAXON_ID=29189 /ORGANISM="Ammonia sp." /LENGTH=512 /DNA_ID=CAMNT_0042464145 /DNA_START=52 /DNA_END=1587 /DNA_ORIENTATION=+
MAILNTDNTIGLSMRIAGMSLLVLIAWPMCIFGLHILRRHWNNVYFVKRQRTITLVITAQSSLSLFVFVPMLTIPCIIDGSYKKASDVPTSRMIIQAGLYTAKLVAVSNTLLVFTRIWLYYFNVRSSRELANEQWTVLLNSLCHGVGWFTAENQRRYASQGRLLPLVYLLSACIVALYAVLLELAPIAANPTMISYWCLVIIASVIVWRKYPAFHDELGIRREIKIFAIIWLGVSLAGFVLSTTSDQHINTSVSDQQADVLWAGILFVLLVSLTATVYMHTVHVYACFIKKQTRSQRNLNKVILEASLSDKLENVNVKSWKPIIAKMDGYELFVHHLIKEFSLENLLFLTEFAQFKAMLIQLYPTKMVELKEELPWSLQLPPKLKMSRIVCEFHKSVDSASSEDSHAETSHEHLLHLDAFVKACSALYAKYIDSYNASLEINISSMKRSSLAQLYGSNAAMVGDGDAATSGHKEEMFKTSLLRFQSAALDIEALMNDSFTRFKGTEAAKEYW